MIFKKTSGEEERKKEERRWKLFQESPQMRQALEATKNNNTKIINWNIKGFYAYTAWTSTVELLVIHSKMQLKVLG